MDVRVGVVADRHRMRVNARGRMHMSARLSAGISRLQVMDVMSSTSVQMMMVMERDGKRGRRRDGKEGAEANNGARLNDIHECLSLYELTYKESTLLDSILRASSPVYPAYSM